MVFVFASICDHASSAFIFSSTSSDQICLVSSEHFRKYRLRLLFTFAGAFLARVGLKNKTSGKRESVFPETLIASALMLPQCFPVLPYVT